VHVHVHVCLQRRWRASLASDHIHKGERTASRVGKKRMNSERHKWRQAARQPVAVIQLNSGRHILHQHARNYLWVMARSHSFIHFVSGPCAKPYHSIAARSYIILARFRQTVAFSTAGFSYHVGREFNTHGGHGWMYEWIERTSECYSYFDFMSDMRAHTWAGEDGTVVRNATTTSCNIH
jgi:hypothetical protein